MQGHNWSNAIATATPIAHKGPTAGAKVQAMTMIHPQDQPAIWLNQKMMVKYRPKMRNLYLDSAKYKTYLKQLGIKYPAVR